MNRDCDCGRIIESVVVCTIVGHNEQGDHAHRVPRPPRARVCCHLQVAAGSFLLVTNLLDFRSGHTFPIVYSMCHSVALSPAAQDLR